MKIFKANKELKTLLIQQGFEDITTPRDKQKGKSAFRINGKGKKEIYFNYVNIQVLDRYSEHDSRYTLTEKEENYLSCFLN